MSSLRGWFDHFHKIDPDFGVSHVKGSSLTIPGQGSDLQVIIQSIVKLPPLDERTFDVSANDVPDTQRLAIKAELEHLYLTEGRNLAEDAKARQEARKASKKANEVPDKNAEHGDKDEE